MIFPDLVKYSTRPVPAHKFRGKFDHISAINEDQNDGYCLVHAINTTDGSSLDDRCFRDYRFHYKFRDHSYRRVTFVIFESYRAIWRVVLCGDTSVTEYWFSPISQPLPVQSIALSGFCLRRNL